MSADQRAVTTYFALSGALTKEVAGNNARITDKAEMVPIIDHLLAALSVYERDGFRFVDVDASATISQGELRIAWSDYGLETT